MMAEPASDPHRTRNAAGVTECQSVRAVQKVAEAMVRSADGRFGMHVVVGGARLREHMMPTARSSAQSAAFVETDFFSPASYRMTTMETDPYGETF
eukprot:SAG25_NODE_6562_length_550_cov_1.354767_1_plen_95_part_01